MNLAIKPLYIIIGATLMLAACSQADEPRASVSDRKPIKFHTSMVEISSRANIITEANLPHFYVTAFDIDDPDKVLPSGLRDTLFFNQKITVTPGSDALVSPNCCWPDVNKETDRVAFFSFYPGLSDVPGAQLVNNSTASAIDCKLKDFSVEADIADQFDFITAYKMGKMADNLFSGVELSFAHQLSRIEIKAFGKHKSCDIEIAGVRIGGTGVKGTFDFKPVEGGGEWYGAPERGIVEYVYRNGDKIVTLGANKPVDSKNAVSVMGNRLADGNENCAMLIPAVYDKWEYDGDSRNRDNKMYISVLVRITDATPTAGIEPEEKQRYPYRDLVQGVNALKVPRVYFAVNKATGTISKQLYKKGEVYDINDTNYYSDPKCTVSYTLQADEEVKEFGWASVPVTGNWEPGYIYTYMLDFTLGVGVHDPAVTTTTPGAGDPVISDRVNLNYSVKGWKPGGGNSFTVPGS